MSDQMCADKPTGITNLAIIQRRKKAARILQRAIRERLQYLKDLDSLRILKEYGITSITTSFASSKTEAKNLAKKLGFPIEDLFA